MWNWTVDIGCGYFITIILDSMEPQDKDGGQRLDIQKLVELVFGAGTKIIPPNRKTRKYFFVYFHSSNQNNFQIEIEIRQHRFFAFTGFYSELSTHRFSKYLYIS